MKKIFLSILFIATFFPSAKAQFGLTKGFSSMEVTGSIQTIYNYRLYKPSSTTKKKNRFDLDYAQFIVKGNIDKYWRYKVDVNLAGLMANPGTTDDNGFLSEASLTYRGFGQHFDIELGYSKLPFSRNSLLSKEDSPFLQRAEVTRGEVFSRRDVGLTLKSNLWEQKLKISAGVYEGLGESSIGNDNDDSGNPEYLLRTELSYPSPFDDATIDKVNSPTPIVCLGLNGRFTNKSTSSYGIVNYNIKNVDGKKYTYGADLAFKFKGFLASLEVLEVKAIPNDSLSPLLEGQPTNFLKCGGIIADVNYYFSKAHTAIAVRYDEFNPSDLRLKDTEKNLSFAVNYFMKGNTSIRIQYWHRLNLESTNEPWTDDQIRLAWQIEF